VDYFKFEKRIDDKLYRLNIWDVSGNEMDDKVLPRYLYRNVDLYVLVFSLDNIHSLNNLKHWVKLTENKNLILVKNKTDLKRISEDTIRKFREEVLKNEVFFEKEFHTNYRDYSSLKRLFNYFYEKFSGITQSTDEEELSEKKKCFDFCNFCRLCY
jgi:GTPase SAR1 family protein